MVPNKVVLAPSTSQAAVRDFSSTDIVDAVENGGSTAVTPTTKLDSIQEKAALKIQSFFKTHCTSLRAANDQALLASEGLAVFQGEIDQEKSDDKARFYNLGKGKNGSVFRVDSQPLAALFVVKYYFNSEGHTAERKLERDLAAHVYRNHALDPKLAGPEAFQLANQFSTGPTTLFVQNVEGVELGKMLEKANEEQREALLARYESKLSHLKTQIQAYDQRLGIVGGSEPDFEYAKDGLKILRHKVEFGDDKKSTVYLYIHPRNIIVTPDQAMVIIDPM